jgi:hypothetical protein
MAKKAGVASQSSKAEDAKEEVAKSDPSIFLKSGKLWPKPLTLIGGSGKHESGKTLFGLSICPGPQTLVYDFEDSSKPYVDQIGFEMIDVPDLMIKKYNRIAQEETFCWWRDHILSQPTGKHRVLMVDPISDIEAGLKMWVQKRPQDFGYTSNQFARMEGVLWECVKAYWKSLLLQIANRVETFYFVAHTKREWVGNTPTPNLLPRGKQTLFELSSLYLFFDRTPVDGRKPQKPAANVLKSRVVEAKIVNGELVATAVLPPRLPEATPQAIRHYMLHPANFDKLDKRELWVDQKISETDILAMRAGIAESELATESLKMDRQSLLARHNPSAAQALNIDQDAPAAETPPASTKTESPAQSAEEPESTPAAETPPQTNREIVNGALLPSMQFSEFDGVVHHHQKIEEFFNRLGVTDEQRVKICQKRNVDAIQQLDRTQTFELLKVLANTIEEKEGLKSK